MSLFLFLSYKEEKRKRIKAEQPTTSVSLKKTHISSERGREKRASRRICV
jgi:hypothetical protein